MQTVIAEGRAVNLALKMLLVARWARAITAIVWLIGVVLLPGLASPVAVAASPGAEAWTSADTYSIAFVGRDGPDGVDHYLVTFDWGGTFFGIATDSMPLMPADKSTELLLDAYRAAFSGRPPEHVQPGDSFLFSVPAGTLVGNQWRKGPGVREFRSLTGDHLILYTSPLSPVDYRLLRSGDPDRAEVKVSGFANSKPAELAAFIFGQGAPDFRPDFLQVARVRSALQGKADTVAVDLGRRHLDDLRGMMDNLERTGSTAAGLSIYRWRSDGVANPLLRIEDAIGESIEPATFPRMSRVYYYKDGVVRTYQRMDSSGFLSARQPQGDQWAQVYADYGRLAPAPTRWGPGQPEQDEMAQELGNLGITVLRFQPREQPRGNFFTRLLDQLLAQMKRKD